MDATTDAEATREKARSAGGEDAFTARLRVATRGEHEATERNRRLRRLTEADLGLQEYVSILARMAGFLGPVEAELRRWKERFAGSIDLDARLIKTELLRRDIEALAPGHEPGAAAPNARFATIERAWGCLYVFEGATLGGQLMARSLHEQFGFTAEHGTAFYNSYGRQTGALWQAFKAALNASVASESLAESEIIAGARATFHALNVWMEAE